VDKDGNEIAGIRLPEVDVPLATFTGWSMRNPTFSNSLRRNSGRTYPFPQTREVQKQTNDPRESIIERYPTKMDYLYQVTKSLLHLKLQRFLLDEDVTRLLVEAAQQNYWPAAENASLVTIKEVTAQPTIAEAGGKILLSVEFEGLKDDVLMVQASVREANNLDYILNDDGNNGDERADDNIWSYKAHIPSNAPSGYKVHIDFQALDKDLNEIYLMGTIKEGMGERGSLIFTIK
jgi:hypothetical protein